MNKCKIAQHTAESMHIRHDDILPLVNNRAKDRTYELNKLKLKLANYQDNKRYKEVKRLTAVIAAIEGDFRTIHQLASFLGLNEISVKRWLLRYIEGGIDRLLVDDHAGGAVKKIGFEFLLVLEALLCFQPNYLAQTIFQGQSIIAELAGRTRWTRELIAKVLGISHATVSKRVDELKIGYFSKRKDKREYCYSTDPDFVGKTILVDLLRKFGSKLGFELWSFDEKTCIQATKHEMAMDASGTLITLDRYKREGVSHLFALLQPATGKVYAKFSDTKTGNDITAFIRGFLRQHQPPANRRIAILMDNLGAHASVRTLKNEFPNLVIVFIPTNASWMNPIESFFGTLTKGAIKKQSFTSVDQMKAQILTFIAGYNLRAKPVKWNFNIKRCLNQRLNTVACLKQAIPNLEQMLTMGQAALSTEMVALCEFANGVAHLENVYSYKAKADADAVTLIEEDVIHSLFAQFDDKPKGVDAYHEIPAVQRVVACLDNLNALQLSDEVCQAYQDQKAALVLIEKLLKQLPDTPYHKKPERKLTKEAIESEELQVAKLEKELEEVKQHEAEWEAIVTDIKSGNRPADSVSLVDAEAGQAKLHRRRINLEDRLTRKQDKLKRMRRRYSSQVKATNVVFDDMLKRLMDRLVEALNLWFKLHPRDNRPLVYGQKRKCA